MYSEILWMLSLNVKVLEKFKLAPVFDLGFDFNDTWSPPDYGGLGRLHLVGIRAQYYGL